MNNMYSKSILARFTTLKTHLINWIKRSIREFIYRKDKKKKILRCLIYNYQYLFQVTIGQVVSLTKTNSTQLMNTLIIVIVVNVAFLTSTNKQRFFMF